MSAMRAWFARLGGLFGKGRRDRELEAEITSHLEMHMEDNIRAGMTPVEARRQAILKLGGIEQSKESYRERRGLPWLETLVRDVRYGGRMLGKTPGLTFILVITLALGIGVNAAVFSIVNGYLLRPLPVPHPEQIAVLASHQQGDTLGASGFSYPDLEDFRNQGSSVFSDVFAWKLWLVGLSADGRADRLYVSCVTGNYFSALGLQPALGRFFLPGEGEEVGADTTVVLGYSYWQTRFGADPGVVGKVVRLNGEPATIIGVAPRGFDGTFSIVRMEAYLPMVMVTKEKPLAGLFAARKQREISAMARLKPGVSFTEARSSVNVITDRLAAHYSDTDKGISVRVIPEMLARPTADIGTVVPVAAGLFLILAAVVLLLVCMNVASILMARATVRRREMAVRAALGAGRGRIVRQMLTEAILLSLLGGLAGVILGSWASGLLSLFVPRVSVPLSLDFHFDWRVAAYSSAIVLFAGIVVGLWPALRSARANLGNVLHEGGRSDSAGVNRHRARGVLVVVQVAGSLMLLIVAALFVRSLTRAERMNLGFDPSHVVYAVTDPHEIGYDEARTNQFYHELEDRVRSLPGVESVSVSFNVPLNAISGGRHVSIEGRPLPSDQQPPLLLFDAVDPDYFGTMRVPLLRGRPFSDSDSQTAEPVAIVNQTMAERFWPGADPIGKRFSIDSDPGRFIEIVGVSGKGAYSSLGETPQPFFYRPLAQSFDPIHTIEVRSSGPLEPLLVEVQQEIRRLSPDLPILDAETMEQSLSGIQGFFIFRLGATMAGVMGLIGLTLAVVGVYGVVSFAASQRTHEIGIRTALGANRRDILKLVLGQGLTIVVAGVVVGLIGGWAMTRAMARFAAGPSDVGVLIFGGAAALLLGVALLACWIPARRAMRVDPMQALRYE